MVKVGGYLYLIVPTLEHKSMASVVAEKSYDTTNIADARRKDQTVESDEEKVNNGENYKPFQETEKVRLEVNKAQEESEEPWLSEALHETCYIEEKSCLVSGFMKPSPTPVSSQQDLVVGSDVNPDHCSITKLSESRYEERVMVDVFEII